MSFGDFWKAFGKKAVQVASWAVANPQILTTIVAEVQAGK
jgi:hypothetical protein